MIGSPVHRQWPCCSAIRPSANSCSTMLRRYRLLPRVRLHSRWAASGSTAPSKAADSSALVSSGDSGCTSSQSNRRPFQISWIAGEIGSPSRTVSTSLAAPRCTICCTTNIDKSSSRCTSSTPRTTVAPAGAAGAAVSDSITPRNNWTVSMTPDSAHGAKAPSGTVRADDVPTAHRTSPPRDAATDNASRAIVLFPTPAAPRTTMPETSEAEMAASIAPISTERPVNGHVNCTPRA